jgi:hypothetical protein
MPSLNKALFSLPSAVRHVLEERLDDYNRVPPHSSLANSTPREIPDAYIALGSASGSGQDFPTRHSLNRRMSQGSRVSV